MGIKLPRAINDDTERSRQDFEIPNGKYLVKILVCEERVPQNKPDGEEFIALELEILDADREANAEVIGLRIFDNLSLTEKAEWRMVNFLDAALGTGDPPRFKGEEIPDDVDDGEHWMIVKSRMEEYPKGSGNSRARVNAFYAPRDWKGVDIRLDKAGKEMVDSDAPAGDKEAAAASKESGGSAEVEI
jgi:hypothetical protein